MFPAGLPLRLRGLAVLGGLWLCAALGCDPAAPLPQVSLSGRVVVSWRIDGAALTAERCAAEGLRYMEVAVAERSSGGRVGFTEVTCALDRYPLMGVPLGQVTVQVLGVGMDARRRACVKRAGTAPAQTTTQFGAEPVLVELRSVSCP